MSALSQTGVWPKISPKLSWILYVKTISVPYCSDEYVKEIISAHVSLPHVVRDRSIFITTIDVLILVQIWGIGVLNRDFISVGMVMSS